MTKGQIAYEANLAVHPRFAEGTERKPWRDLHPNLRDWWERRAESGEPIDGMQEPTP